MVLHPSPSATLRYLVKYRIDILGDLLTYVSFAFSELNVNHTITTLKIAYGAISQVYTRLIRVVLGINLDYLKMINDYGIGLPFTTE